MRALLERVGKARTALDRSAHERRWWHSSCCGRGVGKLLSMLSCFVWRAWDPTLGFPGEGPVRWEAEDEWDFDEVALEDQREQEAEEAFVRACAEEDAAESLRLMDLDCDGGLLCEPGEPDELDVDMAEGTAEADGAVDAPSSRITEDLVREAGISLDAAGVPGGCGRRVSSPFALKVESVNGGSWAAARDRILAAGAEVQAFAVQEHRLSSAKLSDAYRWLAARGWMAVWAPAVATAAGGRSGGVAVIVRSYLGLASPSWEGEVGNIDGHMICGQVGLPDGRQLALASVYLRDSEGISYFNRSSLETLALVAEDSPYMLLAGGDFNMEASTVTGFMAIRT